MSKVKFLVLEGCSKCKALKNKLNYFGNSFKYYPCDGADDFCDKIESLTGVETYPMMVVFDINNNIKEVLYFTEDYNKVGKKIQLAEGVTGFPVYSIDQMVDYITKL